MNKTASKLLTKAKVQTDFFFWGGVHIPIYPPGRYDPGIRYTVVLFSSACDNAVCCSSGDHRQQVLQREMRRLGNGNHHVQAVSCLALNEVKFR